MKKLPLTRGLFALVDDEDFARFSRYKYRAIWNRSQFYAMRNSSRKDGPRKGIYLHREILGVGEGQEGHHKDGQALDCQRNNLEIRTSEQNCQGIRRRAAVFSSPFRGVTKRGISWEANLQPTGKRKYLGRFKSEVEAARAYDTAAKEVFGKFAALNFPD